MAFNFQNPKTKKENQFDKFQISLNLDLAQLSQDTVNEIQSQGDHCSTPKCPLFIRIRSQINAQCSYDSFTCKLSPPKALERIELLPTILQSLSDKWVIYIFYDFSINNDNYKYTQFTLVPQNLQSYPHKVSDFLFSNAHFKKLIFDEIKTIMSYRPTHLILGSEIDMLMHKISDEKIRNLELKSFWSFLENLKITLKIPNLSTSLFFEHMRGTNFWGAMDKKELMKLDFLSFSSAPLASDWIEYSKFYPQFYLNILSKLDIVKRYYNDLEIFRVVDKKIVLTEFKYPWEKSDPFLMTEFLEKSNYQSYFKYIPFVIDSSPGEDSYGKKTTFFNIKQTRLVTRKL